MKRILMMTAAAIASAAVTAQDRIITKTGDVVEAYRVDVGSTYIYYTNADSDDAALQKMSKADVLMIRKKDNSVINLYEDAQGSAAAASVAGSGGKEEGTTGVVHVTPESLSDEAKAANQAIVDRLNRPLEYTPDNDKKESKKANYACAVLGAKQGSVLANEDIEISMVYGCMYKDKKSVPAVFKDDETGFCYRSINYGNPALRFSVKNKTTKTIYLDLANTFFTRMGEATCYYVPSSTTTSTSSSSGGSVNLGAVTGALGIGGAAGTLANGINVGGGSTSGTVSTTYSQRIVAIPPMSTVGLAPQYLFGNEINKVLDGCVYDCISYFANDYILGLHINFAEKSEAGKMQRGDHYTYSETSSPFQWSFIVAYSMTEDCNQERAVTSHFFLKDLLGVNVSNKILKGSFSHNDGVRFHVHIIDYLESSFPKK